jgi:hypothetical protein
LYLIASPVEKKRMESFDDTTENEHYKSIRSPETFEHKSNVSILKNDPIVTKIIYRVFFLCFIKGKHAYYFFIGVASLAKRRICRR